MDFAVYEDTPHTDMWMRAIIFLPSLLINLPNNLSQSNAVEVVRKNRLSVTITPSDREAFLINFDKAIKEWKFYERRDQ